MKDTIWYGYAENAIECHRILILQLKCFKFENIVFQFLHVFMHACMHIDKYVAESKTGENISSSAK